MNTIHSLTLSLPCLVAFFWAILLFHNRKENTRPQNIWMIFLWITGICTLIWIELFLGVEDYSRYYKLDIADSFLSLLLCPMLYLYFWSLTNSGRPTWKQYVWFVPSILVGTSTTTLYYLLGEEQSTDFILKMIETRENYRFEPNSLQSLLRLVDWEGFYVILIVQVITLMVYATFNVIRYKRGLQNFFSNLDEKSIENNRIVLAGLYALLLLAFSVFITREVLPDQYFTIKYYFMALTGVTIYYMSYYVFKIKFAGGNIIVEIEKEDSEFIHPTELHEAYEKILPQFIKLIDEEKVFLHPNITLEDIARQLYSNRTYISRLINEKFGCNFYEFISRKRIEYAKALMIDNPMFSRDEIARESGFPHSSNFGRAFKNQTGMTFTEWHKKHVNFTH